MPWVDDTGKAVSPDEAKSHFQSLGEGITEPSSVPESATRTIGKILPRAGAMTAGAETGAAIGALGGPAAPVTVPLGAAIGGGIGNVAGSKLPEEIGGDPSEKWYSSFLWGAVPEGAARGVVGAVEKRALRKGGEAALAAISRGIENEGMTPAQQAARVSEAIGRPSLRPRPVATGEELTKQTFSLRDSVRGSIDAQRKALGEPIGAAYEALKGNGTRIPDEEAMDLAKASQDVRDELIAPYPNAKDIFAKIKRWRPAPTAEELARPDQALERTSGGDLIARRALGPTDINWMTVNNMTSEQMARILESSKRFHPPTLDELRELRQVVGAKLRSATGGDVHALLNLQQAIDEHLMPHLPPDIGQARGLYKGFIDRFPWEDVNKLKEMGTPREITQYVFGGTPERAHEIITGAPSEARANIKEGFIDHVLRKVDPNLPPQKQVDAIHKEMAPHIANGTTGLIFGAKDQDLLRAAIYSPIHRVGMVKMMNEPAQQEAFTKGWTDAMKESHPDKLHAAEMGMEKLLQSLPPEERAAFQKPPVPGAEMPVLPSSKESLTEGLQPGKPVMGGQYMQRRAAFAAPYSVSRMAIGGGGAAYGIANAMTFMGIAAGSAGYRAIMENGGASGLARLYASPNGRVAARAAIELLAGIGSQALNEGFKPEPDDEPTSAAPASPPAPSAPAPAPAR